MATQPRLCDLVLWFPGGEKSQAPHTAIVTAVGLEAIDCNVFSPGMPMPIPKEGTRHISDPKAQSDELRESGGWMFRDEWYAEQTALKKKRDEMLAERARQEAEAKKAELAGVK